jgi:hypothetical protein
MVGVVMGLCGGVWAVGVEIEGVYGMYLELWTVASLMTGIN